MSKSKHMAKSNKGGKKTNSQAGNVGSDGQFHYFGFELIKNPDGTILAKWSQLNPLPDGYVLKSFQLNKHLASWDEQTAASASATWLGSPYGLFYGDPNDVRTFPNWAWEFLDPYQNKPGDPAIKYNIVGDAGFPNDISSSIPVGSEVLTVIF